jgi:hypothetical protein
MGSKVKELNLNGIVYNTANEVDRRFIGKYYELKLLSELLKNNVNVKYISNENKFSSHDFIINIDGIKYITELKSRLMSLNNHSFELICQNKINTYKTLIRNKNTKILFIFNHITTEDNYNFFYYIVDVDMIDDIAFLNLDYYNKPTYELPIKYLKPLENLFKN